MLNCLKDYTRCIHISHQYLGFCSTDEDQIQNAEPYMWFLLTYQCKEPEHQQLWYWPSSPRIFQPQHQKGIMPPCSNPALVVVAAMTDIPNVLSVNRKTRRNISPNKMKYLTVVCTKKSKHSQVIHVQGGEALGCSIKAGGGGQHY